MSPDAAALARRLERLGLSGIRAVEVHQNRTVMVSLTRRGVLRVHRGYRFAPDSVLEAIVRFVRPRARRLERLRARRELLAFPVAAFCPAGPPPRRERPQPGDARLLEELGRLWRALNREYFEGRLAPVPIRLSGRMRTRLGELVLEEASAEVREIVLSRRHVKRDGWAEVRQTLLHEMVHQWQAENRLPVDHGRTFRRKAVEVGVEPGARRRLGRRRPAARYP
jgi:hypothetical protein